MSWLHLFMRVVSWCFSPLRFLCLGRFVEAHGFDGMAALSGALLPAAVRGAVKTSVGSERILEVAKSAVLVVSP